jgi:RNA polymerase sigma-70 factor (ECF subfamily)
VEDVAQETYLRYYLAYRNREALDGDSIHRWLYVAAKNESLRAARKHRRAGFSLLRFLQTARPEAESPPPENVPSAQQLAAELPPKYKEATMLRLAGLNVADIARRLRIAPGTVKSRLSRGRQLMQRMAANERRS